MKPTSTGNCLKVRRTPENHRVKRLELLTSPGFLVSLFLLLLNDLVLKPNFDNWLVGKLSDFAGLFAFALFWTALFPRYQKLVFVFSAVGFIYWETPWSQPLIDAWNGLAVFSMSRTVDYTDLTALLILLPAYIYVGHARQLTANVVVRLAIVCFSLFAFVATSKTAIPSFYQFNDDYYFSESWEQLLSDVHGLGYDVDLPGYKGSALPDSYNTLYIVIPSDFCPPVEATITIRQKGRGSRIQLHRMDHSCDQRPHTSEADKQALKQLFEGSVVNKLQAAGHPSFYQDHFQRWPPYPEILLFPIGAAASSPLFNILLICWYISCWP